MKKILLVLLIGFVSIQLFGAPYNGEVFTFEQPDGSKVDVLIYGDEYYARAESFDGYSLVRDEKTGWLCYAELSEDGTVLVSTGIKYFGSNQGLKSALSLEKHIDISKQARLEQVEKNKEQLGVSDEVGNPLLKSASSVTGNVKGLTILVDFSDQPHSLQVSDFEDMLNGDNFTRDGNDGSVKKYYLDISNGLLTYENVVFGWFRANKTFAEYNSMSMGVGAREILLDALNWVKSQGFDFSTLTVDSNNKIKAINIIYTGYPKVWSKGLWYHKGGFSGFSANGVGTKVYNCSPGNSPMSIGTICHENGHMVCGWADTYKYEGGQNGLSSWDLMCSSNGHHPPPPNPLFRYTAGWSEEVLITDEHTDITTVANDFTAYKYPNPSNSNEYFLIESRLKTGRNSGIPDEGLTIWHIDKDKSNQATQVENQKVYVEHACSSFSAHNRTCFKQSRIDEFSAKTLPSSNWHSGEKSNFRVYDISAVGSSMTFKVDFSEGDMLNKDVWKVVDVKYASMDKEIEKAFDKSAYSAFICQASPTTPFEVTIDLGAEYDLTTLKYLPRYQQGDNAIEQYEFYVSSDGENWGSTVSSGNWDKNDDLKVLNFNATGQYVKLVGLSNTSALQDLSILELYLYGNITSTSKPNKAYEPEPVVNKVMVNIDGTLTWNMGDGAESHKVYLSEDGIIDSNDLVSNQTVSTYDYSGLNPATTYYWRVDEVNANGTTTGDVWTFTTYNEAPYIYYKFDGDLTDSAGANDATNVKTGDGGDAIYDDGVDGSAYRFTITATGGYSYIKSPANIVNFGASDNQYTVMGWYKVIDDDYSTTTNKIFCQITGGSGTQRSVLVGSKKGEDPYWLCVNTYLSGANVPALPANTEVTGNENMVLPLNEWFHLAVTTSINAGNPLKKDIKIYLNGELIGSASGVDVAQQDGYLTLGYKEGNDYKFNGLVDEFAIYAYPLTGVEIKDICSPNLSTSNDEIKELGDKIRVFDYNRSIVLKTKLEGSKNVIVYGIDGQPVYNTVTTSFETTTKQLPVGIYIVSVSIDGKVYSTKVMVK